MPFTNRVGGPKYRPDIRSLRSYLLGGLNGACVRLWLLQEQVGAATAVDECGNANGTYTSCTLGVPGKMGRAVAFDGAASVITMANGKEVAAAIGAASVVALVRSRAAGAVYSEENLVGAFTGGRLTLSAVNSGGARLIRAYSAATGVDTDNIITTTGPKFDGLAWTLCGASVDVANDLTVVYRNGFGDRVAATTNTGVVWEAAGVGTPPLIGQDADAATFFTGDINFVAVFNRFLTQGEHREIARRCGF